MYKGKYVKLINRYDEKNVNDYSSIYILIFLIISLVLLKIYQ